MDSRDNVLIRTWRKLWIDADATGIEALVADPYLRHTADGDVAMAPADYGDHIARVTSHLRGTDVVIADLATIGDMIYARFTLEGINLTTGNPVRIAWIGQYRTVDGKLAESWTLRQTDASWAS
ncbi:MAG: nuclear transport factor 2 family protein [Actinomycetota bacterium]